MATAEAIAALRLLIAEPDDVAPYDDATLSDRLDASTDYALASQIWTEKAATAAGLVDTSEGGSSRKMGDLYEQALSMAERMRTLSLPDSSATGVRIRNLTRP